ncbi:MAG: hypothetical protein L7H00_02990 [Vulcanisaeta sp.]|nr:hypothetical protein [Vulcanisaeta sp.]
MALAITTSGHHPQPVVRVPVSSGGKTAYLRDAMDVTKKMQILDAARFASKYGNIEDLIVIEGTVTELNTQSQHYCATASTPLITTWDLKRWYRQYREAKPIYHFYSIINVRKASILSGGRNKAPNTKRV